MLYEFVFSCLGEDTPFSLCLGFPLRHVPCSTSLSIGDANVDGLVTVSNSDEFAVDPMSLLPYNMKVSFAFPL